jgi:hypothetical protein
MRNAPIAFACFLGAVAATVGTFRRLPPAYGAYALASLVVAISFPTETEPFYSLPRFVLVMFPLFMWLATWVKSPARVLVVGAVWLIGLIGTTALFSTWRFVG